MGGIVSSLAFPVPPREMSKAALLRRGGGGGSSGSGTTISNNKKNNQLVYLKTKSGYTIPAIHLKRRGFQSSSSSSNIKNKEQDQIEGQGESGRGTGGRQQQQQTQQQQQHGRRRRRYTILYSHGNAEDVGLTLPYLDFMSHVCDCDVLAYEYCGYSIAEGDPSEEMCYECIHAAYTYLTVQCSIEPSAIVLYGRSLGTGPTVDLASKLSTNNNNSNNDNTNNHHIGGCILQSPLESAGRCVLGSTVSYMLYFFDIFRNYEKIESLAPIPVFILHGMDDRVVPVSNGIALYDALCGERVRRQKQQQQDDGGDHRTTTHHQVDDQRQQTPSCSSSSTTLDYPPMWIPNVGHNDMPDLECMEAVRRFVDFIQERQQCKTNYFGW